MECRNLHKLPPQSKGVLCVIKLWSSSKQYGVFRLCYVWKLDPSSNSLQCFCWKGATSDNGSRRKVPNFHGLTQQQFFKTWEEHFDKVMFLYDKHTELQYLSQVYCARPFMPTPRFDRLNRASGAFEASLDGPDVLDLPSTFSTGGGFPKINSKPTATSGPAPTEEACPSCLARTNAA
jgi:hypothetical protein